MRPLHTERLVLRNWQETDRDLFHEINADRKVMEFFPFRRTRKESDALFDKVRNVIDDTGFGFYAVALLQTNEPIGFCGLSKANIELALPPGSIEIGWRLATRFWGRGYITEAALALLERGFSELKLGEVVSFAVAENRRSTAVMERIGLRHDPQRDFDHPRVPESRPDLRRHLLYAIDGERWRQRIGSG